MILDCTSSQQLACGSTKVDTYVAVELLPVIVAWSNVLLGVVAVVALFVAFRQLRIHARQLRIQQQHDRLSVEPNLIFKSSLNFDSWAIEISNRGLGPAIVTRFQVRSGDRTWESVSKFMSQVEPEFKAEIRSYVQELRCQLEVEIGNIPIGTRYPAGFNDFVIKINKKRNINRSPEGVIANAEYASNQRLDKFFLKSFGGLVFEYEYTDIYHCVIERTTQKFWRAALDFETLQ